MAQTPVVGANQIENRSGDAATSTASGEVIIQALTEEHLEGAHAMAMVFVGERKAMCLCCKYSWCPTPQEKFNEPYLKDPEDRMAGTAVAIQDGKVIGFIQMSTASTYVPKPKPKPKRRVDGR